MERPQCSTIPNHGGDLSHATDIFGAPKGGWLDLSTGINPTPYPDISVSQTALSLLPSMSAMQGLLAAARSAYGVSGDAALCAAPGTQALIQVLPSSMRAVMRVAVIGPTYCEHAKVWRQAGHQVTDIDSLENAGDAEIVIVTNPNNPDGRAYDASTLKHLWHSTAAAGGLLIVDEAFADVAPAISLAGAAGPAGLVVLRSFGKFFGLAGLRLGFAVGSADLIDALSDRLGPWAVSGPAIEIGTRALRDEAWIIQARMELTGRRERLDGLLRSAGFTVVGGTDLFCLVEHKEAHAVYQHLGRNGILVREFSERSDWLRFGLPGDDVDFVRLERALG